MIMVNRIWKMKPNPVYIFTLRIANHRCIISKSNNQYKSIAFLSYYVQNTVIQLVQKMSNYYWNNAIQMDEEWWFNRKITTIWCSIKFFSPFNKASYYVCAAAMVCQNTYLKKQYAMPIMSKFLCFVLSVTCLLVDTLLLK